MMTFRYKAMTPDGAAAKGIIQAVDEYQAVQKIRETCPVITEITPIKEAKPGILDVEIGRKNISAKSLAVVCSQFAIMLKSGMPIGRCIEMIAKQTENKTLRKILFAANEDVVQGSTVASALERAGDKKFPVTFIETIRAGEQAGTLEDSFEKLQVYYEKTFKNAEKMKQVMTYPIFVVVIAIIVLIVIMAKVVPALASTFADLGGELPLITQIMINTSNWFARYWLVLIIIILGLVVGSKFYQTTEKGRLVHGKLMLKVPVLGKINVLNGAAQFAETMAAMLGSGLTVNKAVEVTAKVLDNAALSDNVHSMIGKIEEGHPLGECIRQCDLFPDNLKEMCAIGEETGELDETLKTIGEYYTNEANHETSQAIARLEPAILVIMAIFAGFIVISIYLPMFTMYNLM
ncbi:MAG: type II secretion system F family protein [Eubacterium sp.]|nr:type II secretion system F family protein [Eubacterium sp.]